MSDYPVLADVGETLKKLLWEHIRSDNKIYPDIISSEDDITLDSPADLETSNSKKLSLYLYRIIENQFLKNQEIPNNDPQKIESNPLAIDLFYIITPGTEDRRKDHILLGKVMQVFHDHAVVRGSILKGEALSGSDVQLRLVFYSLPFEEIIELWQSFSEKSFHLSVCYQVTPIRIDSTREIEAKRVVEKRDEY
ncbi:MAG: DUF4255 domain-containing protein [Candidatus Aminicenantes bacterium]|nr:MAG: DUF4255 domain-containing protein [Candidatus Aminicenantes bacterium]